MYHHKTKRLRHTYNGDIYQFVFKNKILVAIVICYFEIQNWLEKHNCPEINPVQGRRVPEDKKEEFLSFCEDLYERWISPLNYTYSSRFKRIKSNIKFFKRLSKSKVNSLGRLYNSGKMRDHIIRFYEEGTIEYDLPERKLAQAHRDFMNWCRDYLRR